MKCFAVFLVCIFILVLLVLGKYCTLCMNDCVYFSFFFNVNDELMSAVRVCPYKGRGVVGLCLPPVQVLTLCTTITG